MNKASRRPLTASVHPKKVQNGGMLELKRRLLFVLLAILVYRIGAHVPVPGLDPTRLAELFSHQNNGILGLFNMFSGEPYPDLRFLHSGCFPIFQSRLLSSF